MLVEQVSRHICWFPKLKVVSKQEESNRYILELLFTDLGLFNMICLQLHLLALTSK